MTKAKPKSGNPAKKAAIKKPSDRLKKDGPISLTALGREWEIKREVLDDWELLEDLNDAANAPSAVKRLLGDKQYADAKDLLRVDGRISAVGMTAFLEELFAEYLPNR